MWKSFYLTVITESLTQDVWLVQQTGQQLVQWQQARSTEQRQGWCISANRNCCMNYKKGHVHSMLWRKRCEGYQTVSFTSFILRCNVLVFEWYHIPCVISSGTSLPFWSLLLHDKCTQPHSRHYSQCCSPYHPVEILCFSFLLLQFVHLVL